MAAVSRLVVFMARCELLMRHRHKSHVLTVAWDYCPDHCPEQMDLRGVSDAEEESNCLDLLQLLSSGELT